MQLEKSARALAHRAACGSSKGELYHATKEIIFWNFNVDSLFNCQIDSNTAISASTQIEIAAENSLKLLNLSLSDKRSLTWNDADDRGGLVRIGLAREICILKKLQSENFCIQAYSLHDLNLLLALLV